MGFPHGVPHGVPMGFPMVFPMAYGYGVPTVFLWFFLWVFPWSRPYGRPRMNRTSDLHIILRRPLRMELQQREEALQVPDGRGELGVSELGGGIIRSDIHQ